MCRTFMVIGAVFGLLGVLAGTFAAHGLKDRLSPEMLTVFETGARYQMYHALALLFVGLCANSSGRLVRVAGWLFVIGIIIFSGSLYALALTGMKWWGMVTPVGGSAFLAGWGLLIAGVLRRPKVSL